MQNEKQWEFIGFNLKITDKIEQILMNDDISYWFHFRTITWYQIRRIRIQNPLILKKIILEELNIDIEVDINKKPGDLFSKWIIKPSKL